MVTTDTNWFAPWAGGITLLALCGLLIGTSPAIAADEVVADGSISDWIGLFNADGSINAEFIVLNGGRDAYFASEDLSAGAAVDYTALFAGEPRPVDNAMVASEHDLAEAYFYVDAAGVIYAGLERAAPQGDSHIKLELTQSLTRLGRGAPWEIVGASGADDLVVRFDFVGGALSSVEVQRGIGDQALGTFQYETIESLTAAGCNGAGTVCVATNSAEITQVPWSEQPLAPNAFLELRLDAGGLLGAAVDYTSARVTTPEDVAFVYFGERGWE
jgi:hypothetical protein